MCAGGCGRRVDGGGLELRDVGLFGWRQTMNSPWSERCAARPQYLAHVRVALALLAGCAAWTPLTVDEPITGCGRQHLAFGSHHRPRRRPLFSLLGTLIGGCTTSGAAGIVLPLVADDCAVYRTAAILFVCRGVAAPATLLLNITLMRRVGTRSDAGFAAAGGRIFVLFFPRHGVGRPRRMVARGPLRSRGAVVEITTALAFRPAILIARQRPQLRRWLSRPAVHRGYAASRILFLRSFL